MKPTQTTRIALRHGDWFVAEADLELHSEGILALDPSVPVLPGSFSLRLGAEGPLAHACYDAAQHAIVSAGLAAEAGRSAGRRKLKVVQENPPVLEIGPASEGPSLEDLGRLCAAVGTGPDSPAVEPGDAALLSRFAAGDSAGEMERHVAERSAAFALCPGFQVLAAPAQARDIVPYPHQLEAVRRALGRFRGRALLCDEVGLGKTVEAGLVLLELVIRKLVRRVLILTPPSLTEQWREEMLRKFGLDFALQESEEFRGLGEAAWRERDRVIASFHTAKRAPHSRAVLEAGWDMIVIDEAHHLRNRDTNLWRFASELRSSYLLLLTATPVQNDLRELFNLIQVLRPGHLETAKRFERNFVSREDRLKPRNADQLQELLAEVMVRNRRSSTEVALTRRRATTLRIEPSPEEASLYEDMTAYIKSNGRGSPAQSSAALNRMTLMTLQAELGSSPSALVPTLDKIAQRLPGHAGALRAFRERAAGAASSAKIERLVGLLRRGTPDGGFGPDEKLLVFTRFQETQAMIVRRLREERIETAAFNGALDRRGKEDAVHAFAGPSRVLVSTESGGEGRNLQFCRALLNYDLPWNPMRIEQRIGRLSRIGQAREVLVFNFSSAGTIEASILDILDAKINLFELVVGEVGMILGRIDEEVPFEDLVFDRWICSATDGEFRRAMDELGDRLGLARREYAGVLECEDRLFGDRFRAAGAG